jgi:hypothetical protein
MTATAGIVAMPACLPRPSAARLARPDAQGVPAASDSTWSVPALGSPVRVNRITAATDQGP